jgi:hypothetical protein
VGVQGSKAKAPAKKGNVTVGDIAYFHEFGIGNNSERSWLRAWVDENKAMIEADMAAAMRQILLGRLTADRAANILGLKWVGSIQKRISQGIPPPNADSTIAKKRSSTPLVDTGQLKSSITHALEKAIQTNK